MARHEEGYTLAELVVVILIFSVVMTLISISFNRIVAGSGQISRSVESDIGGLIGLELLRSDLESAGFGLPWTLSGVTYQETTKGEMVSGYPGTSALSFNDDPPEAPKAYKSGNDVGFNGSDYLVLKGTPLAMSGTSRSWSYMNYTANGVVVKPSKSEVELIPGDHERTIVLKSSVRSGSAQRELVAVGSTTFTLVFDEQLRPEFLPKRSEDQYLVYGVAPKAENSPNNTLVYPYNRADYYISRDDDTSQSCAGHTGVLYKATMNHQPQHPTYTPIPILDCVADLQVVFMMETSSDGILVPENDISGYNAEDLRALLKEVRVYVMAQQGKRDPDYSYPAGDPQRVLVVGDRVWSKSDFVANGWLNYHWKVYTIVVQPKNL